MALANFSSGVEDFHRASGYGRVPFCITDGVIEVSIQFDTVGVRSALRFWHPGHSNQNPSMRITLKVEILDAAATASNFQVPCGVRLLMFAIVLPTWTPFLS